MTTQSIPVCRQRVGFEQLRRLEPIRALSGMRLRELSDLCLGETMSRGVNPIHWPGAQQQSIYLLSGELKLAFPDGSSNVLVGGSGASLWPLTRRPPAPCSAKAITDVELVRIDDEVLDIMMTWDQLSAGAVPVQRSTEYADWPRMSGAFRLQNLTDGALARLPPASIDALFSRFERIAVKAGEVLVREGDAGDFYYIVDSGRCAVTRAVGGVEMPLAELKSGDAFGEEALVADSVRNASVTMRSDGVLLRLKKSDFIELLREPLLHRVGLAEAEQKVADGALWLDVRYPAEYRNDRLPGALNVPLDEIRNAIGGLDRRPEYIVYCQSGRRSSAAAFLLAQRGYRACWLGGGFLAGTLAGSEHRDGQPNHE